MSDWEPTTEDIRNDFARDGKEYALKFDRWLFEMQEDAWDRGYQAGVVDFAAERTNNPYRITVSNETYDQIRKTIDE